MAVEQADRRPFEAWLTLRGIRTLALRVAQAQGKLQAYPNLAAWLQKLQARPAYRKAVERGGEYAFAK